jgi:hypothetical protein
MFDILANKYIYHPINKDVKHRGKTTNIYFFVIIINSVTAFDL